MANTIFDIPVVPGGYVTTGKYIMIHDTTQPESTSTKLILVSQLMTSGSNSIVSTTSPAIIPAGKVVTLMVITTDGPSTIRIGVTPGGDELMEDTLVNTRWVVGTIIDQGTTVYITGTFVSVEFKYI